MNERPIRNRRIAHVLQAACALALILTGIYTFANGIDAPFVFDDADAVVSNRSIRTLWPITTPLDPPKYTSVAGRPILNLTFAIDYHFHHRIVRGYHYTNIAIHVLAGLVLMGIIRRTLERPIFPPHLQRASIGLSFIIALLWTVHPLQTESVTYITQRAESLACLLIFLTLYCFILGATFSNASAYVAATVFCALGMASKEIVAAAPVLVLLYDRTFLAGSFREAFRRRKGVHVSIFATGLILFLILLTGPRSTSTGFAEGLLSPAEYALTQFGVITHYIFLSFYPVSLCLDYGWEPPASLTDIAGPMIFISILVAATLLTLWKRPPLGFLGVWFFLILAPTSSIVPIADAAFEHRMYAPLAAVIVLVVISFYMGVRRVIESIPIATRAKCVAPTCTVLIVSLACTATLVRLSRLRNEDYRSTIAIWADTVQKRPSNARAYSNLGVAYFSEKQADRAQAHLRRAIELDPNMPGPRVQYARFLSAQGDDHAALEQALKSVELNPGDWTYRFNLGVIYAKLGQDDKAREAYEEALLDNPEYADAWYNLGNLALRAGNLALAASHYRRAIEAAPEYVDAHVNLAAVLKQSGRDAEARAMLDKGAALAAIQAAEAREAGFFQMAANLQSNLVKIWPAELPHRVRLARDYINAKLYDEAAAEILEARKLGLPDAEAKALESELAAKRAP